MFHVKWTYCSFDHFNEDYLYFYNYVLPPVFGRIPLNAYLYLMIAIGVLGVVCWRLTVNKKKNFNALFPSLVWFASTGFILVLLAQICWQQHYLTQEIKRFAFKDYESRLKEQSPDEQRFLDFVLFHVQSGSSCYAVGSTNPRYLRYALYPKILMFDRKNNLADCVLVFKMNYPLQYVPKSFNRVRWYDKQSLIAFNAKH